MNTLPKFLTTIGIESPIEFPTDAYESVHAKLRNCRDSHPIAWGQYAGAWNAVAYRFLACVQHDEAFTASINRASGLAPQPERFIQEKELFGFFTAGLATIEAFYYGVFAIASIFAPSEFPFSQSADFRRATPQFVARKFQNRFPSEPITAALQDVLASSELGEWNEIRNVLVHRALPGRSFFGGSDEGDKTVWFAGVTIDACTTAERRKWLSSALLMLMYPASDFCSAHF
jgi:hypothetical protein